MIKKVLTEDLLKKDLPTLSENDRKFSYTAIDLKDDGKQYLFVGLKGSYFCGNAGCTAYLLDAEGKKVNSFSIVDGPIRISKDKTNGWHDLIIPSRGINYLVRSNGHTYPSNPSMQPKFTPPVDNTLPTALPDSATTYTF